MEVPKEYFNLYVEFQNAESTAEDIYDTFIYTLLDTDEINPKDLDKFIMVISNNNHKNIQDNELLGPFISFW